MEQLKIRAHQTIRLGLDFNADMRGHELVIKAPFKIETVSITWLDDAIGTAGLLIPSEETAAWPTNSTHRLTIATVAENGDVEVWGTVEFKVIP